MAESTSSPGRRGVECTEAAGEVLDQVSKATKIPKIHLVSLAIERFLPAKFSSAFPRKQEAPVDE